MGKKRKEFRHRAKLSMTRAGKKIEHKEEPGNKEGGGKVFPEPE